jgi:DNA-binding PadR family transcriptional regulator
MGYVSGDRLCIGNHDIVTIDMSSSSGLPRASFLILLALADGPAHGLGIVDRVESASQGAVTLGPGTLYGTLQSLAGDGLIRETSDRPDPKDDDPRRRYYRLTPKGERELRAETGRLRVLVDAATSRLGR